MNLIRTLNRNRWNLAFFPESELENVLSGDYKGIRWMKYGFHDRWFADPFILNVTEDAIVVLVEELSYNLNRGRIAKLIVDKSTMRLKEMKVVMDIDTHLSFPMILRRGKEIVIMPENSASGSLNAYLYNSDDDSVKKISTVAEEPLTDAVICTVDGHDYLLATSLPSPNGDTLTVYKFNRETLVAEKLYDHKFSFPIARNAGSPFTYNGKLYRPAQDCEGAYGKGVVVQEIDMDVESGKLSFKESGFIYPFSFRYQIGLHTLNYHDGMFVIDGRGLLHPFIGRIVRPAINLIRH